MKLPLFNEIESPYNKNKITKSDLKNQIFKRIRKYLNEKLKSDPDSKIFNYIKIEKELDDFAKEILEKSVSRKVEINYLEKHDNKNNNIIPLTSIYSAYLLYYYFLFGETKTSKDIFLFEVVSEKEMELLGFNNYNQKAEEYFIQKYDVDKEKLELIKNFLKNIEKSHPGVELASSKSYDFIKKIINEN